MECAASSHSMLSHWSTRREETSAVERADYGLTVGGRQIPRSGLVQKQQIRGVRNIRQTLLLHWRETIRDSGRRDERHGDNYILGLCQRRFSRSLPESRSSPSSKMVNAIDFLK